MPLSDIHIFRMTHIDNMAHILANGITHKNSPNANPNYVPIGDRSIINKRDITSVELEPNEGEKYSSRMLGAYTPFYFGPRSPMLLQIQTGYYGIKKEAPYDIVYCRLNIQTIVDNDLEFIFTDGHAMAGFTSSYPNNRIKEVRNLVDLPATRLEWWNTPPEAKNKKEAEFLIFGDISIDFVEKYLVYNEGAKQILIEIGIPQEDIIIDKSLYF